MKKSTFGASALRRCGVLLLAVMLIAGLLCAGSVSALSSDQVSRLNVMLVIDGSGSLTMDNGTDLEGHRYEAIDLFLALLTNDGNNVGAIVFNHETLLNSPIAPITGKADKLALSQKIREAGAQGDTNTGDALQSAVDACTAATAENGMNSVILLFSDGNINMDYHGGDEAVERSKEAQENAITKAQGAGIPIHTICLNATSYSHPEEMQQISDRTGGTYAAVSKATDLTATFENFYRLIFPNSSNEITQTTFPSDGKLSLDIQIPTYGAEEVNVILDTTTVDSTAITAPSGVLSGSDVDDSTMSGGFYDVIKLVDPEKGLWNVSLTGTPGTNVTVNVLYNIDSAVQLKTSDGKNDYGVGDTVTLQAQLLHDGNVVNDEVVTQEYTAKLYLTNTGNGEVTEIDMTPQAGGVFTCTFTGSDYSSFVAKAELLYSNLVLGSNDWSLNYGNTAPVAIRNLEEVKQTVTPISGKSKTVDVTAFFTDAQDTQLTYTIVSSQVIQGTANLDSQTGTLTVDTGKSKSGDIVIQAADSQGATAQMTVRMKVTNLTWVIFGTIIAAVLAGIGIALAILLIALNKPFKGMLTVVDINGGIQRTRGGFRGKLTLEKIGIVGSGIEKGAFVAIGNNQVEFRSANPIYTITGFQTNPKRIILSPGPNTVYADEAHTRGIEIDLQPSMY